MEKPKRTEKAKRVYRPNPLLMAAAVTVIGAGIGMLVFRLTWNCCFDVFSATSTAIQLTNDSVAGALTQTRQAASGMAATAAPVTPAANLTPVCYITDSLRERPELEQQFQAALVDSGMDGLTGRMTRWGEDEICIAGETQTVHPLMRTRTLIIKVPASASATPDTMGQTVEMLVLALEPVYKNTYEGTPENFVNLQITFESGGEWYMDYPAALEALHAGKTGADLFNQGVQTGK